MSIFTLCGLAALTNSSQSFLIPYFNSSITNYNYAQELDRNFKISNFYRFSPERYRKLSSRVPRCIRSAGDDGVLAFQTSSENIETGSFDEILHQLRELDLSKFSPFFKIEAYSIIGNDDLLHKSNCEAANLFSRNKYKAFWIEASQSLARQSLAQRYSISEDRLRERAELDVLINRLLENPSDEEWYNEWKRHWTNTGDGKRLIKIALWWIEKTSSSEPYLPYILEDILTRVKDHGETKLHAYKWLNRAKYGSPQWSKVWNLCFDEEKIEEPLFSHGLSFLEYNLKHDSSEGAEALWSSIWSKLWKEKRHVTYMVGLAQSAVKKFGTEDVFINKVLAPTLESNRLDVSILDSLSAWLRSSTLHSKVWENVFIYFLNDTTYRKNLEKFARETLLSNPESAHWFYILRTFAQVRPSADIIGIARDWTKTQSKSSTNWQDVMLIILESSYVNQQDIDLAKKVAQYPDHYKSDSNFDKLTAYLERIL